MGGMAWGMWKRWEGEPAALAQYHAQPGAWEAILDWHFVAGGKGGLASFVCGAAKSLWTGALFRHRGPWASASRGGAPEGLWVIA